MIEHPGIGGDRIAGGQQHQVAGHQLARGHHLLGAVAQHPHLQGRQPAQCGHRALGAAFLQRADQRVDQHHRQDHPGVALVAERHRQRRGDEQDGDQRAGELPREGAPQRPGRRLGQRVGAVLGEPPRGGAGRQAPLGMALQMPDRLIGRKRMPGGRVRGRTVGADGCRCGHARFSFAPDGSRMVGRSSAVGVSARGDRTVP